MRIGLVPLDERPRSLRIPGMLARVAGAELVLPPPETQGNGAGQSAGQLAEWLRGETTNLDGLVVALDRLGNPDPAAASCGSRPLGDASPGLQVLSAVRSAHSDLPVLAYALLAGLPDPAGISAQPDAWLQHTDELQRLSDLQDRRSQGEDVTEALAAAEQAVPGPLRTEVALARLRTRLAGLTALSLAAQSVVDLLVVGTGGTGPLRLSTLERAWLADWVRDLQLGGRTVVMEGTHEVEATLVTRLVNEARGVSPRIGFYCPVPSGERRAAGSESGPVSRTVLRQIRLLSAELVTTDAELALALHPPSAGQDEEEAATLADEVTRLQAQDVPVAIADVAVPGGGDTALIQRLRSRVSLPKLAGYAAGGTAGDALGAALAQGMVRLAADGVEGRSAHELLVLHRFLDDWGYRTKLRSRLRRRLVAETGAGEPEPNTVGGVEATLERDLANMLAQLPSYAGRYRIVKGSVSLTCGRTFECDFALERLDVPPAERG